MFYHMVRLQLFALAYNLGNFHRQMALPKPIRHWTMTTLREKLIKFGAKVVSHPRYTVFQMADVAVSRELLAAILGRVARLGELVASTAEGGSGCGCLRGGGSVCKMARDRCFLLPGLPARAPNPSSTV